MIKIRVNFFAKSDMCVCLKISDIDVIGLFYFEDHNCYQSIDKYNKSLIGRIHFVIRQFIFA